MGQLSTGVDNEAIVAATFVHEMGHHIAGEVLGDSATIHSAVGERLDNRNELAADMFVSMAAIPHAAATAMFRQRGESIDHLHRAFRKICARYGIRLKARDGTADDLTCLFGSLHYLKLREALLTEFRL